MLVSPISQPHLICGIHVGPWLYEISDRLLLPHLCREQQRPHSVLSKVFTWEERNANYHFHSYIECRLRYQVSYKSTGVKKMTMENEYVQLKRSPINQRHFMYDLRSLWLLSLGKIGKRTVHLWCVGTGKADVILTFRFMFGSAPSFSNIDMQFRRFSIIDDIRAVEPSFNEERKNEYTPILIMI